VSSKDRGERGYRKDSSLGFSIQIRPVLHKRQFCCVRETREQNIRFAASSPVKRGEVVSIIHSPTHLLTHSLTHSPVLLAHAAVEEWVGIASKEKSNHFRVTPATG
jgi:hypothetical protein